MDHLFTSHWFYDHEFSIDDLLALSIDEQIAIYNGKARPCQFARLDFIKQHAKRFLLYRAYNIDREIFIVAMELDDADSVFYKLKFIEAETVGDIKNRIGFSFQLVKDNL